MADAAFKPEKDYSKEVDQQLPEAEQLAKTDLQAAIEKLSVLEKQARQASDLASTSRILVAIVTLCKNAGNWALLNEQTLILSKKHGQLKQAITKMVQTVMDFLDQTPTLDIKLSVIETLRTVTEGKIFVEVERARVTKILSDIKKQQGDLKAATDILCELQVETFGSMERREKVEFILAQVGLCIEMGDWTQAGILSRKISTRYLARKPKKTPEQLEKEQKEREKKAKAGEEVPEVKEDDVTDLKLQYYQQQITLAKHDSKYLDACKHYRQVLDTEAVEEDPAKLRAVLQRIIYFIILAPYDNEQHDLLHRIHKDTRNTAVPKDAELLELFTVQELMRWPEVSKAFGPHLCSTEIFDSAEGQSKDEKAFGRWQDLRKRVIEHNVRVVAKYYTRIQMGRLTQLLDLTEDETEKYISELVTSKTVYAKIDRPARVVNFAKPRDADDILNEWSFNMKSLLGLLERVDHLITKEEMMARIQPGAKMKKSKPSKNGDRLKLNKHPYQKMPFKISSKPFVYCVGNPKFDPAKAVQDVETHRAAMELLNEKNDFEGAIRLWFGLPEREKDEYVYHAVASVTLPQVQSVVELRGRNGLHGWYDGGGEKGGEYYSQFLNQTNSLPDIPPPPPPSVSDIHSYTHLFSPSHSPSSSLKSFVSNAKKDSIRSMVSSNLTSKRYLHPSYPGLVIPKVKNLATIPLNPYLDFWEWSCKNLEWCGPVGGQGLRSHHLLPVLMHHFGCVVPSCEALSIIKNLALEGVGGRGSSNVNSATNNNNSSSSGSQNGAGDKAGNGDGNGSADGGIITSNITNGHSAVSTTENRTENGIGHGAVAGKKTKNKKAAKTPKPPPLKILDVGSGNGYWSFMLRQYGLETVAVDNMQSEWRVNWIPNTHLTTGTSFLKSLPRPQHKNHILLLVYPITGPDGNGSFTRDLIKEYKGDVVIVSGTQNGNGYTGFGRGKGSMDEFMLESPEQKGKWEKIAQVPLPSFAGRDEGLFVYVRGQAGEK
ncbi:PCI domain-containing protein [Apiosordaria backusii]|uniref:PCI domain-containing protein n=1 Tax=Apiosordaria backusii TaxID=314023 RepID=A0AA40ANB3_9PEZI|nr:PCI domain-containing protein [Apiosordaria backusii]